MSQTKAQLIGGLGISTAESLVVGSAVTINSSGINVAGIITATSFYGDGSNLTGLTGAGGTENVVTNSLVVIGVTTVASGSTSAPVITPSGDPNTGIFFPSADTIAFAEGGVESVRFNSSGGVQIANGNLVFSTSGTGIDFSAGSNAAGMTSELLSDYEEGTWTPSQGGGLTVVGTFSSSGTYTKIGRTVVLQGKLSATTSIAINGTDIIICGNLPFNPPDRAAGTGIVENHSTGIHLMIAGSNIYSAGTFAATSNFRFTVTYSM